MPKSPEQFDASKLGEKAVKKEKFDSIPVPEGEKPSVEIIKNDTTRCESNLGWDGHKKQIKINFGEDAFLIFEDSNRAAPYDSWREEIVKISPEFIKKYPFFAHLEDKIGEPVTDNVSVMKISDDNNAVVIQEKSKGCSSNPWQSAPTTERNFAYLQKEILEESDFPKMSERHTYWESHVKSLPWQVRVVLK